MCFSYAGGAASLFRPWPASLTADIELVAVQYPGREDRRHEDLITDFEVLIDHLNTALGPVFDRPYAFFGHSMGALVTYELASRMEQRGEAGPVHLFVSAAIAPGTGPMPTAAPAEELAEHIDRYFGGLPPQVRADEAWVRQLTQVLAADFAACRSFRLGPGAPHRLAAPITGFVGDQDLAVSADQMVGWSARTDSGFVLHHERGPHLFIREGWAPVVDMISATLSLHLLG
ncbi:thioesterase II family protein [Micromonospora sp. NPDC049102]|uniref:thioesterase II family protein n=1 Tax=Micromonospora sp. NPDC049102 TaxID=3364265 RepID=UPI0037139BFA